MDLKSSLSDLQSINDAHYNHKLRVLMHLPTMSEKCRPPSTFSTSTEPISKDIWQSQHVKTNQIGWKN